MSTPSRASILHLYGATLRASRSFTSYNFRQYFIRRTRASFRSMRSDARYALLLSQDEKDSESVKTFYETARQELDVLRRSAIVNSIYGGRRLVVERGSMDHDPAAVPERGSN
ncbi:hypothetical protein BKA62DRAFT_611657 [Auriculariales sp. MPI-PUGE-AT-0066]|nr:hypothetical protein BKA62DRAFT_611657 [Auriculariales sp. MPI-PUGE-AT-0066]